MSITGDSNPYAAPQSDDHVAPQIHYVGFWLRVVAALIDTVIVVVITSPLLIAAYGWSYYLNDELVQGPTDVLVNWVLPAAATICLWVLFQATPGKMVVGAKIVDARTGRPASKWQYVIRYLGYYVSILTLMLGILWVAFDRRKQGLHDKMAGTVVIRSTDFASTDDTAFSPQ
jgi:uncharacterized RDD family membrane protein YckC